MKKLVLVLFALAGLSLAVQAQGRKPKIKNSTYQPLPFSQDWSNTSLLSADDDWSAVPGIIGYLGDAYPTTSVTNGNPDTVLMPMTTVDLLANKTTPNTLTNGGVAEFEITNPVVALQGSGTADAPNIVLYLNTTGYKNVLVSYNLVDIDGAADNSVQQYTAQYRVGGSGNFINIPAAHVNDASEGPSLTGKTTPVSFTLPAEANDNPAVEVRIITTNAAGSDEWVGIDDILVNGDPLSGGKPKVNLSLSSLSAAEGSTDEVVVTATASEAVSGEQTVEVAVTGEGITAGDYTLSGSTITIADGQTTGSVTLTITDDSEIEGTETLTLSLTSPSDGIDLGAAVKQDFEITDNDANEVTLGADLFTVGEGDGTYSFTVMTTQNVSVAESVTLDFSGAATENSDFTVASKTIEIPAGTNKATVSLTITDDSDFEGNEKFTVKIASASSGLLVAAENSIEVTIVENDQLQAETILAARQKPVGSTVIVKGTVTASFKGNVGSTIAFQDGTAGVQLYDRKTDNLVPGDSIYVRGKTSDRYGAIQIITVDSLFVYPVKGKVTPKIISSLIAGEEFESQLVLVKNLKIPAGTFAGNTNYVSTDRYGSLEVRITGTNNNIIGTAVPADSVDVVGLLAQFNAIYQLQPRSLADFVAIGGVNNLSLTASATLGTEADQTLITLTAATLSPVNTQQSVDLEVSGAGITASDYELSGTTITIPAGSFSGSVTFKVKDDSDKEGVEIATVTLVNPTSGLTLGSKSVNITISDNDEEVKDYISVAEARALPVGSIVTVVGRVSVANEFGGPAYFQDKTGGMAVFQSDLHAQSVIGDSIKVTGPTLEFNTNNGEPGTGLFEISGSGITFTVFKDGNKKPEPKIVTLADINESLEGQLVKVLNVTVSHTGAFQANKNYTISDPSGSLNLGMRIDNSTNLVNATAPTKPVDLIGVVSQAFGSYQIMPRFTDDLGVEGFVIPGENVPKSETFEIATWNMKWFGQSSMSGLVDSIQIRNAIKLIRTMDLDVYAVQEISNDAAWKTLKDSLALNGYAGILAPISQQQKTAFLYRTSTISLVSSGLSFNTGDWGSGRFPYEMTFDATIGGKTKRITAINIHAKATTSTPPEDDLNRREMDAIQLKNHLDSFRPNDQVIVLGDYNDDVTKSTVNGLTSPYSNFVSDPASYKIVTKFLSERGQTSYRSSSMLDHIMITNELYTMHWDSTQRIENPFYIGSYLSSTSDHFPVWTRFRFNVGNDVADGSFKAGQFTLFGNYPNPFNPSTTIRFNMPQSGKVRLTVFNTLGQIVSEVTFSRNAGVSTYDFNASELPSGVYLYTLESGQQKASSRFILVK